MNDREERLKAVLAKEKKLKLFSGVSFIALGLSLQASINPPSPIPFLQDSGIAYSVLALSVVGAILSAVLILPVLRERVLLSQREEQ